MDEPNLASAAPRPGAPRYAGAMRLAAIALLAFATYTSPVMAQWGPFGGGGGGGFWGGGGGGGGGGGFWGGGGDDNAGFWLRERERERMTHQRIQRRPVTVRRAPPVRRIIVAPHPATPAPTVADKPATPSDKPAVAQVEPKFFIAVLGDSLGVLLAQGLQEAYADRPEIAILRKAKGDTGLVTEDIYDWPKAVRDLLASNEKISMAIMMIGSNDHQPLRDASGRYEANSAKWKDIYGNRVEEISKAFKEKKIPLVWVGLPVAKSDSMSTYYTEYNEIYRERAAKYDASFVDTFEAFGDSRGAYNAFGPDINGVTVKLRAGDGVHFTKPGARKLAHFVEGDVKREFDKLNPPAEPGVANLESALPAPLAPAEAPATPQSPAPTAPAPAAAAPAPTKGQQAALPDAAATVPAVPPKPAKPLSGPILPLTTAPLAPGGDLARRSRPRDAPNDTQVLVDRALVRGQPLEPKPNRADDFAWPRADQP